MSSGVENEVLIRIATDTLTPLPEYHRRGLTVLTVFSLLSFISTTSLWIFISIKLVSYRLKRWSQDGRQRGSRGNEVDLSLGLTEANMAMSTPGPGGQSAAEILERMDAQALEAAEASAMPQVVVVKDDSRNGFPILVYNLLFADLLEALAYGLSIAWLVKDGIFVESAACWAQGWLGSTSNLAASLFLFVISVNTYITVVRGYKPPDWIVYSCVGCLWAFVLGVNAAGVLSSHNGTAPGGRYFARANVWCWISATYDPWRLWGHYFWIMVSVGFTIILYGMIFFTLWREKRSCRHLPRRPKSPMSSSSAGTETPQASGYHPAFLIYPWVYIVCITPLATGRIALLAGKDLGISYFCFAGSILAANGLFNTILWTSTILFSAPQDMHDTGLDKFRFLRTPPRDYGNTVVIRGPISQANTHDGCSINGWKDWWWWKFGGTRGWGFPTRTRNAYNYQESPMSPISPVIQEGDQYIHMEVITTVAVEQVRPDGSLLRIFFPSMQVPSPTLRLSLSSRDESKQQQPSKLSESQVKNGT